MIAVADVESGSLAEKAGMRKGDKLLSLNGEELRDRLDFDFQKNLEDLDFEVMRGSQRFQLNIRREFGRSLGIEPEIMKIHICKNNCVFCFVYQNPKGMRRSMYVKDEDYRYSFLDGHFTTLSNMGPADWERVLEQKLSPIYISVHATEPGLRGKLLRNEKLEPILHRLNWLKKNKIDFHTQLVIIPGWNDGPHLTCSMEDLMTLYPSLLSISVVPIGLTQFRDKLPGLRTMTKEEYNGTLDRVFASIEKCQKKYGVNFIYPSDEFFSVTGRKLPDSDFYGDFSQYENGVGTLRAFLDDYKREKPSLPNAPRNWEVTILTGNLAERYQIQVLDDLKQKNGLKSEVISCINGTFGPSVTVTGLLCGKDFSENLMRSKLKGPILIPPNSLNQRGCFLDDMVPTDIEKKWGRRVVIPNSFKDYFPSEERN